MNETILNNPVRVYSVLSACLALIAYYVDSLPLPLLLSLFGAVLGVGGEVTRSRVTPVRKTEDRSPAEMVPARAG
jgi:hypothetical protein